MEILVMKTESSVRLPLDAVGALELGQKQEAVRIVRDTLGLDPARASELVERYLRQHPPHPLPFTRLDDSSRWLWTMLAGLTLLTLSGLIWLG